MAFYLYVSTSLESLAGKFREEIYEAETGKNPLNPVVAAVQTQGIATWLKQYIATHSPIAMNLKMPFLKSAISQTIKEYYPGAEDDLNRQSLDRDTWRLFQYLSSRDEFLKELDLYLKNDPDKRKQYQISRQIAATFEQYRTYRREDMIQKWLEQKVAPAHWQEKIFRDLFSNDKTLDFYISHFIQQARTYEGESFKKQLTIFGISSMPPLFLKFFQALAKYQDVSIFYLAPSADYWDSAKKYDAEDPCNNPLLQALGTQGRAFFDELLSSEAWNPVWEDENLQSGKDSFLGCLQNDIRNNKNLSKTCSPDGTVLIENCHTPLREIEILHDRLLREIKESGRKPGEILVTAPNIETYVPYIETVFGTGPLSDHYTIADRSLKDSGSILPAMLRILRLTDSDYNNTDIFSLLEVTALQRKFQLSAYDIRQIQAWCISAGIRWGVDGSHREQKCGVNFEDFSWRQGVRRLLLGYAVGGEFGGVEEFGELPLDFAEGSGAEKLGNFLDFLDEIFRLRDEFTGLRTPQQWFEMLKEFPDRFFQPEEPVSVEERAQLIRFLAEQAYESSPCEEPVPFSIIYDILEGVEVSGSNSVAFLRGKITFCSMVPMRTIPMQVIAILGLNAGEFPRRDVVPGFNLIAKEIRSTDRSKNSEDRYLLLETLLAAKEKLFIFYNGQNPKDNTEVFPTPPLAELMQYLDRLSGNERANYFVKHRIQGYFDSYFDHSDPLKFTYSEEAYQAALAGKTSIARSSGHLEFADLSSVETGEYKLPDRISLAELERFFRSPVEHFLMNQNLGKFREFYRVVPENDELFQLDALSASRLKKEMILYAADWYKSTGNHSVDYGNLRNHLTKKVQLPCRFVGKELFADFSSRLNSILADAFLKKYTDQHEEFFEAKCVDPTGKEVVFTGTMLISNDCTRSCSFHTSGMKQRYLPSLWLRHLFLSSALPEYTETVCQFVDNELILKPLCQKDAQKKLLELAEFRELGKEKIVPFFSEVEAAGETPTRKGGKAKVETEGYKNSVKKAIGYDYCASLFFKEYDLDDDFMRKVSRATRKIYEGLEI